MKGTWKIILSVLFVLFFISLSSPVLADDPIDPPPAPIVDTTPPVISLSGDAIVHVDQDSIYTDAGATASDDIDGDITVNIAIDNKVNTTTTGSYEVTYTVSDTALNSATPIIRTVIVDAPVPPPPPPTPNETLIIRDGSTVLYQGSIPLPDAGTVSISGKDGTPHDVDTRSVLAVLYSIDTTSDAFSISDLEYYDSFGAFYLKCLTPKDSSEKCDNWQYAVGSTTPFTGIDTTILSGGETIGLYFGSQHQVTFDKTSIIKNGSIVATAQQYNYVDNTFNALTGVTIGATQPDPNNPWSPTVITSGIVDANGSTTLTLANAGSYNVGIAEDYYFPSYVITVTNPVSSGGGSISNPTTFSVPNAIEYLKSVQSSDGSFGGSDMYTDWVVIAYSSANFSSASLLSYLNSHSSISSLLTDNERRAMAILAVGQNPYSFSGLNFIDEIIKSFDGTQFGDASLTNDDIFALIPLAASGYTSSDDIITKDVQFIISKQQPNGSWEGSVDLTSAAIQAMTQFQSISGVSSAISKANSYISNAQSNDGGWNSVSSTSWAMQAASALNITWTKSGHTGIDSLAINQTTDGAVSPISESQANRIWATSYAIPAALGKSWNSILHSVSKQTQIQTTGGGQTVDNTNTQTTEATQESPKHDEKIIPANETDSKMDTSNEDKLVKSEPVIKKNITKTPSEKTKVAVSNSSQIVETPVNDTVLVATVAKSGFNVPITAWVGSFLVFLGLMLFGLYKRIG